MRLSLNDFKFDLLTEELWSFLSEFLLLNDKTDLGFFPSKLLFTTSTTVHKSTFVFSMSQSWRRVAMTVKVNELG